MAAAIPGCRGLPSFGAAQDSADVAETWVGSCSFFKELRDRHSQSAGLAGRAACRVDHTVFRESEVNECGRAVRYLVRRMMSACNGSNDGNPLRLKDVTALGPAGLALSGLGKTTFPWSRWFRELSTD